MCARRWTSSPCTDTLDTVDTAAEAFQRACDTATRLLAEHARCERQPAAGEPDRYWVSRSLWFDLEQVLSEADGFCRAVAEESAERRSAFASCRSTLAALRHLRLDLAADAVSPTGGNRFLADLERLHLLWEAWRQQARDALTYDRGASSGTAPARWSAEGSMTEAKEARP
jgi:hypothetical protein